MSCNYAVYRIVVTFASITFKYYDKSKNHCKRMCRELEQSNVMTFLSQAWWHQVAPNRLVQSCPSIPLYVLDMFFHTETCTAHWFMTFNQYRVTLVLSDLLHSCSSIQAGCHVALLIPTALPFQLICCCHIQHYVPEKNSHPAFTVTFSLIPDFLLLL